MQSGPDAPVARTIRRVLALMVVLFVGLFGWDRFKTLEKERPELFPWTELSLSRPIGPFTEDKLAGLSDGPARCAALVAAHDPALATAIVRRSEQPACGYEDGVDLSRAKPRYGDIVTSCPVAAALAIWTREVVSPAAALHLSGEVVAVEQLGSFSCRRLYGRPDGPWSEHATADAIDISGFRLADGRRISVFDDWDGDPDEQAFLRAVRDGACRLFRTTLSPDYNAAHRDHLHLDVAASRAAGWSICR